MNVAPQLSTRHSVPDYRVYSAWRVDAGPVRDEILRYWGEHLRIHALRCRQLERWGAERFDERRLEDGGTRIMHVVFHAMPSCAWMWTHDVGAPPRHYRPANGDAGATARSVLAGLALPRQRQIWDAAGTGPRFGSNHVLYSPKVRNHDDLIVLLVPTLHGRISDTGLDETYEPPKGAGLTRLAPLAYTALCEASKGRAAA